MVKCGKNLLFLNKYFLIQVDTIIGTYECKADAKGRLMLPAGLKKQLDKNLEDGFVLKRSVFQNCLELYPMKEWQKIMLKVNKLNRFIKKNNDFIRLFTAGLKQIQIDGTGRILLSKDLQNFASIEKEVVLASAANIIEIWDKQLYEEAVNGAVDDFGELAEQVMGNLNFEDNELS